MSDSTDHDRLQELEAGRILGDLDAEEQREWQELASKLGTAPDQSLELIAAAIETEALADQEEALPPHLRATLGADAETARQPGSTGHPSQILRPGIWARLAHSNSLAWGVAAGLAILLIASFLMRRPSSDQPLIVVTSPTEISPEYAKVEFLKSNPPLTTADFGGVGPYEAMSGEVIWSDERQEGYLTLSNLPPNDPARNQYQLWIVDPNRDDEPVDGGVFDIPAGKQTAVIPIQNPLTVSKPQAFVITLEQPGGVVVSKQDVVVALAKPS